MRFGGMAMNKDSINAEMRLNKAEYDPQKFLIVADSFFYATHTSPGKRFSQKSKSPYSRIERLPVKYT